MLAQPVQWTRQSDEYPATGFGKRKMENQRHGRDSASDPNGFWTQRRVFFSYFVVHN